MSAMGICAFFYMQNLCGVVVFHRSMVDYRRGMGSVCHGYMCILIYMKLMQCSGVAYMYGQLKERGTQALGICAFFYM